MRRRAKRGYECGRSRVAMEDRGRSRRPVLYSNDNLNMMAMQSSRARLICQLVGRQESTQHREFSSYFHGPNRSTDPPYSITSHAGRCPVPKRKPVVPTYPSLIHSLRFNPKVKASSIQFSEAEDTKSFKCKCDNCNEKHCPSKAPSSCTLRPTCRDNIMTFCDRCTMTPKLNDACCGGASRHPSRTSEMCVPSGRGYSVMSVPSEIAVRGAQGNMQIHQMHSQRRQYAPIPILKKQDYDGSCYEECFRDKRPLNIDTAVRDRDVDLETEEQIKTKSIRSFFHLKKKDTSNNICPRKILYNEGISDDITDQYPIPTRVASPVCSTESSRASIVSQCYAEEAEPMPHSHRNNSKYHVSCKNSQSRQYVLDSESEEVSQLIANPKLVRRCSHKYVKRYRAPTIRLPRKVLTSERDIETYMDTTRSKLAASNVRRKRTQDY